MTPIDSTQELVERGRRGDMQALDRLLARYAPILSRWLHGRLPPGARDVTETADLVQIALMRALQNMPSLSVEGPGAFFAFLRHVSINLLRDEARRSNRRPIHQEVPFELQSEEPGPLGSAIDGESFAAYDAALAQMDLEHREILIMRIELGLSFEEIARLVDAPSVDAARMRVARLLVRLSHAMVEHRP